MAQRLSDISYSDVLKGTVAYLNQTYNTKISFETIITQWSLDKWTETALIYPEIHQIFSHCMVKQHSEKGLILFLLVSELMNLRFKYEVAAQMELALNYLAQLRQFNYIKVMTSVY